tara:strand:+ start:214 stop:609 length:396 start_codon:yes stop_codon:yes gene_type:complete
MKKDSAFKLKSGNKPSIAKFFGKFAKGKKVTATSGNTVTRGISKPDAKKRPKSMQNLNKAISDALPKGNLRKKISDKITSKKSKTFKGKKGDPYTYRKTKDGGYEYSKDGKKFTKATSKKAIEAISKIAPK